MGGRLRPALAEHDRARRRHGSTRRSPTGSSAPPCPARRPSATRRRHRSVSTPSYGDVRRAARTTSRSPTTASRSCGPRAPRWSCSTRSPASGCGRGPCRRSPPTADVDGRALTRRAHVVRRRRRGSHLLRLARRRRRPDRRRRRDVAHPATSSRPTRRPVRDVRPVTRPSPGQKTGPGASASGSRELGARSSEVHVAAAGHGGGVLLGLVGDDGLGGEEQGGDRRRVLQRRAGDLGGVDDADA